MPDIREALALLAPGAIHMDATGGRSDARQMLAGALASIRPKWGGHLLLARYAADNGAWDEVEYALMAQMAEMVWPEKHPPNTWRPLVRMAIKEYMDPPECPACRRTGQSWALVDGALQIVACPSCSGRGTRHRTDDERAEASGVDWSLWGPRYRKLQRALRVTERAALATMREAMAQEEPVSKR